MIILYKNGTGLYSKLQHWFSGHPYNHIALHIGKLLDMDWVYEASEIMSANPVNLDDPNIEIWGTNLDLTRATKNFINREAGKLYGFLQILYFIRRKLYDEIPILWKFIKLFHKADKPVQLNNWFPRGNDCIEAVCGIIKEASYTENKDIYNFIDSNYNLNNLYVSDIFDIFAQFPQYFYKIKG